MKPLVIAIAALALFPLGAACQGSTIVRVDDPFGSHCIDAASEDVTIHVRRIFLEKTEGLFTSDNRAGVLVSAKLTGRSKGPSLEVQVPSVTLVDVKNEKPGRLSLPVEYQIASFLSLTQDDVITTDIALSFSLAKTRDRNKFGELVELAGKALDKLSIPNNPYEQAANKFLTFTNDVINQTTAKQLSVPFAEVALSFNKGKQTDLNRCKSEGKERTGVIAVLRARGLPNAELIPVSNTEQLYCFQYSSANTYELLAAKKSGGHCPEDSGSFQAVNNDYVMLILSAHNSSSGFTTQAEQQAQIEESSQRCAALGLDSKACGVPK